MSTSFWDISLNEERQKVWNEYAKKNPPIENETNTEYVDRKLKMYPSLTQLQLEIELQYINLALIHNSLTEEEGSKLNELFFIVPQLSISIAEYQNKENYSNNHDNYNPFDLSFLNFFDVTHQGILIKEYTGISDILLINSTWNKNCQIYPVGRWVYINQVFLDRWIVTDKLRKGVVPQDITLQNATGGSDCKFQALSHQYQSSDVELLSKGCNGYTGSFCPDGFSQVVCWKGRVFILFL